MLITKAKDDTVAITIKWPYSANWEMCSNCKNSRNYWVYHRNFKDGVWSNWHSLINYADDNVLSRTFNLHTSKKDEYACYFVNGNKRFDPLHETLGQKETLPLDYPMSNKHTGNAFKGNDTWDLGSNKITKSKKSSTTSKTPSVNQKK